MADEMSPEELREIEVGFIITGVILPIIGVMGVVGNSMSLAILCRREMRSSINLYLSALSVYDSLLIVTAILCFACPAIHVYCKFIINVNVLQGYKTVYPYMIKYLYPMALIAQTGSIWITVSVTIERYIAVCHPLKARSMCTMSRAKTVITVVSILSLAYNMPRFWETGTTEVFEPGTNITYVEHCKSALRKNKTYYVIYYLWMYLPIMNVVPFLALAVFNVLILYAVRKARSARIQMSRREEKEMNTAMMLICIVAIFFACNTMTVVINILEYAGVYYVTSDMVHTSNLLVTFNSSVNFVIYCIFGKKFKILFLKIFCGRQPEQSAFSRAFSMKSTYGTSHYDPTNRGPCRASYRLQTRNQDSFDENRSSDFSNGALRSYPYRASRLQNGRKTNKLAHTRRRHNWATQMESPFIIVCDGTQVTDKDAVRL